MPSRYLWVPVTWLVFDRFYLFLNEGSAVCYLIAYEISRSALLSKTSLGWDTQITKAVAVIQSSKIISDAFCFITTSTATFAKAIACGNDRSNCHIGDNLSWIKLTIRTCHHVFQLRCSTFACCCRSSDVFTVMKILYYFINIDLGHSLGSHTTAPFGAMMNMHIRWGMLLTIWTKLVIWSRERQVLRCSYYSPSYADQCQLISRLFGNDLVGSSVLPTHFEPMGFWVTSRLSTIPTSQTLQTKGSSFRHP